MEDRVIKPLPGGFAFLGMLIWLTGIIIYISVVVGIRPPATWQILLIPALSLAWFICLFGFKVNNPNNARIVQFFGDYVGTIKDVGIFYVNPFSRTTKVSLRVRTFETDVNRTSEVRDAAGNVLRAAQSSTKTTKVNDKDGTPIEIAAVVVWKVVDAAKAKFVVDDYEEFVRVQADSALRTLASQYSYDAPEVDLYSLRGHIAEVAAQLRCELHDRMQQAGVEVQEARISKLAYAPEIAAAMLQRQQAGAIIAARARIVEGAVGMVEHALEMLQSKGIVELDAERKAAMVCNLLVVLCGHATPQPVLNTGTLHN
jgi:regulator of protease activity HflC (stomatin/prohibitin superfamily)